jgi:hypothetical protein
MASVDNAFLYRHTPLEKRYLPMVEGMEPAEKFRVADTLSKDKPEPPINFSTMFQPHQGYIDSYNERAIKEKKQELKMQSQTLYNEDGQRFGRVWDYPGYKSIHDPLSNYYFI